MQTGKWMLYSDSSHFSDKLSYKILFIPSYRLKDMDLASLTPLQQFSENRENGGTFLTGKEPVWVADRGTEAELTGLLTAALAPGSLTRMGHMSAGRKE
jgi:hypothetical protein